MFKDKTESEATKSSSPLQWEFNQGGAMLQYRPASGDPNRFRGRILLELSGSLDPPPSTVIDDAMREKLREHPGVQAYDRVIRELKKCIDELCEAERRVRCADGLASVAIKSGAEIEAQEQREKDLEEAVACCKRLRRRYELLRRGAEEGHEVASQVLKEIATEHREAAYSKAHQQLSAAKEKLAASIAEHLPEVAAAQTELDSARRKHVDADKLIESQPAYVPTLDEDEPELNEQDPEQLSRLAMGSAS